MFSCFEPEELSTEWVIGETAIGMSRVSGGTAKHFKNKLDEIKKKKNIHEDSLIAESAFNHKIPLITNDDDLKKALESDLKILTLDELLANSLIS